MVRCECYIYFVRCFPVSPLLILDVIMWIVGFDPLFLVVIVLFFVKNFLPL